ncbi:DUF2975 domain-containing protein [Ahrensia sp. 13_GOM-1096m]|jgi:hypothetical protein|uniref:DUF2975 domain-containing protein n=1 Tax=Ahrensia sp. 13_GOM-1096m TaxID=1380380 RepID=UPI00047C4F76|nr:DUF2975 domain-containing protein [Ahrensia sp. 13_GOM-1096m]
MIDKQITRMIQLSCAMRWLCWLSICLVALASIATGATWFFERTALADHYTNTSFSAENVSIFARATIILINSVTVIFICRGLAALASLFAALQQREVLTTHSTGQLRLAGFCLLFVAIYGIAARTVSILILTNDNPFGERELVIGFGTNELFALLMAGTLFVLGHVLSIAASIEEENKGFV